jgi:hypothetical protein
VCYLSSGGAELSELSTMRGMSGHLATTRGSTITATLSGGQKIWQFLPYSHSVVWSYLTYTPMQPLCHVVISDLYTHTATPSCGHIWPFIPDSHTVRWAYLAISPIQPHSPVVISCYVIHFATQSCSHIWPLHPYSHTVM